MPKKTTQEEFLAKVATEYPGFDFSQFTYTNWTGKSTVICRQHGEFVTNPQRLYQGVQCPVCRKVKGSPLRLSIPSQEFLVQARAVHGDRYAYPNLPNRIETRNKVTIRCAIHGEFQQTAQTHLTGVGCKPCGQSASGTQRRLSHPEYLQKVAAIHGDTYDLSQVSYIRSVDPITVVCRRHGPFYPSAGNFLYRKSGCPTCAYEATGLQSRLPFEDYITRFRQVHGNAYQYLEIDYSSSSPKVVAVCPTHGEFRQFIHDHARGCGCDRCSRPIQDRDSFIQSAVAVHGNAYDYSLVEYTDAVSHVRIVCPTHGEFKQAPTYHVNAAHGCPSCANVGPSKGQIELFRYAEDIGLPAVLNYRYSKTSKSEIDIYFPTIKVGIEFNGLYFHSTRFKLPGDHLRKQRDVEAAGIRLIQIYSDEWRDRSDPVKFLLLYLTGCLPRVGARSCQVEAVGQSEAELFYDAWHVQGSVRSGLHLGLRKSGSLVALMTFSQQYSHRGRKAEAGLWELTRYATSTSVVGGASRLFTSLVRQTGATQVVSYSDNRMFSGGMYEKLGFQRESVSPPNYEYVDKSGHSRINKSRFQRKHLPQLLGTSFDPAKSERENCEASGYFQIYDCGLTRWVWK